MKRIPWWVRPLPIIFLAALASTALSQDPAHTPYQTLAELTFDFGEDVEFDTYSVDFMLHQPIENGVHLLIAPIADLVISGKALTAGLVTDAGGYHFKHQHDRETDVGKAIGLWMPGTNDDALARPKEDALFDRGDEAHPYIAAIAPMDWDKGHYTLFVRKQSERTLEGEEFTWIEASIYSHLSGRETYSGSIRFDGTEFTMGGTVRARIAMVEGITVPTARITLGSWKINDKSILPLSAKICFPEGAPPRVACSMVAKDVSLVLGAEVNHKKDRKLTKTPNGYEQTLFSRKSTPKE